MFDGNPNFEHNQKESNTAKSVKRKRSLLTVAKKVEILDCLAKGDSYVSVAKQFKLNDSTVRTIKQAEQSIRHSARYGCDTSNNKMFASRAPCIEMMETKLNEWIQQQPTKITNRDISETAKRIFNEVKTSGDGTIFMASNSWLSGFKQRFEIKTPLLAPKRKVAEFRKTAEDFRSEIKALIEQEAYAPEQVFSLDEDILFWKRLPIPNLTAYPEKVMILLCCNATGDFMSKPLVVHHRSPNPHDDETLPVFWRANARTEITEIELEEWYLECFLPSVSEYLKSKGLPCKLLILMDNVPKYAAFSNKITAANVTIRLLSCKNKHKLPPIKQGIFSAFRRYYLRRMLSQLSQNMFLNPTLTLFKSWREFCITNGVEIIRDAIDEITASDINACWRALWPEAVQENSTVPNVQIEIEEIIQVVREISDPSCYQVQIKDLMLILGRKENIECDKTKKMIEENEENITVNSDGEFCVYKMIEDPKEFIIQNEADDTLVLGMPMESLNQIFSAAQTLQQLVLKVDPYATRSAKFSEELEELLRPYKEEQSKLEESFV